MSPLKIAMVAHANAPWTPHYARFFLSRGHSVWLGSFAQDPIEGVNVIPLSAQPYQSGERQHEYFTAAPKLRRQLREFGPDVVFAPYVLSNGLTASLAWRGPLVVSARGGDILQQGKRSNLQAFLQKQIVRRVCQRADAIHAVSQELSDAIQALGISPDKITVFPVGVDVERFHTVPSPALAGGSEDPHIICTRNQDYVYENHVIIQALATIRERGRRFRCTMLGGGPLLEERKRQAADLGLGDLVTFLGKRPHDEIPNLLSTAQIYVSASSSDGTSASLLEAMASGIFPVLSRISSNTGWIEEERTGFYFEVGDSDGLANQLERALDDAELRAHAARLNRKHVESEAEIGTNMLRLEQLICDTAAERGWSRRNR